jgi:hypothetical protein
VGKIEGRIKVTGRRGKRRKQLSDHLKETREYLKLKEVALQRTLVTEVILRNECVNDRMKPNTQLVSTVQ